MRVHTRNYSPDQAGAPTPVIASAGIGKTADDWGPLPEAMGAEFAFTGWDMLGHGQSPVPDDAAEYTRDRAVDDLDDVVRAALGSDGTPAPVLLGHSLGGYLTMAWAVDRSGAAPTPPANAIAPRALVLLATGPGFRDAEKREAWNARSRRNAHRFGVPPQAAELNCQEDAMVIERVPTLDIPTLLVVGTEDRPEIHGGCSYLAAKMPNARMVTIEGGDHLMHESPDHAALIAAEILAFLA